MKKCMLVAAVMLLLSGCGAEETFETIGDVQAQPVSATVQQVLLELPEDAQLQTAQETGTDKLYLGEDYTVSLQTLEAGDLDATLRATTGYGADQLTLMQTDASDGKRYHCAWTTAGEGQTQVCRTCIIDDGSYHYVLTVMLSEETAGQLREQTEDIFQSFRVVAGEVDLNTGS